MYRVVSDAKAKRADSEWIVKANADARAAELNARNPKHPHHVVDVGNPVDDSGYVLWNELSGS
jgi:hypothetical protein